MTARSCRIRTCFTPKEHGTLLRRAGGQQKRSKRSIALHHVLFLDSRVALLLDRKSGIDLKDLIAAGFRDDRLKLVLELWAVAAQPIDFQIVRDPVKPITRFGWRRTHRLARHELQERSLYDVLIPILEHRLTQPAIQLSYVHA